MKLVALVSAGKDSCYAMTRALQLGHEVVGIVNLYAHTEQDSYTFQSAGTPWCGYIAKAMQLPFISRPLLGKSVHTQMNYIPSENDEIEDLYDLLTEAKYAFPDMQGVISGATASNY